MYQEQDEEIRAFGRMAAFWFWVAFILIMLGVAFVNIASADEGYDQRVKVAIEQNNAEIRRRHELEVERAKIEVQMRLQDEGAAKINVNAVASNSNSNEVKSVNKNQNG